MGGWIGGVWVFGGYGKAAGVGKFHLGNGLFGKT